MLYAFGAGEIPISVSGAATPLDPLRCTIRAVGGVSGALCAVALTWLSTGRRKELNAQLEEVVQGCWHMIKA